MKLLYYSLKYKDRPNTYDEVVAYLQENKPTGNYTGLITTFISKGQDGLKEDKAFYRWLQKNYKRIVSLQGLRETEGLEDLEEFLFNFGGIEPIYNQKWHFYVSYLAFLEYWAETGNKKYNGGLTKDQDGDWFKKQVRFRCKELLIWYTSTA